MFLKRKKSTPNLITIDESEFLEIHQKLLKEYDLNLAISLFDSILKKVEGVSLYKNQIEAAISISEGKIIEMATGEGKTYAAILSGYLNYLRGKKTYLATANEYLSQRDAILASKILSFLGVRVGYINGFFLKMVKKNMYNCDFIYSTIDNFIFDYLRDDNATFNNDKLINNFDAIILDEADLALIDTATNPLFLTGTENNEYADHYLINRLINSFEFFDIGDNKNDFEINFKSQTVSFNDMGYSKVEKLCLENNLIENKQDLYLDKSAHILEQFKNALTAKWVLKLNEDYVISKGKVFIIDKKTGRVSDGSKFESGLQQAVEAFNKLVITKSNKILSMITVQSFLKKFKTLSGMTGTIYDDRDEIKETYGVDVVKINQNKENVRYDAEDLIFYTKDLKLKHLVSMVKKVHDIGRPILVGTLDIEDTYLIQNALLEEGVSSVVLNAINHHQESEIIKDAGRFGSIVIATNMAGRGTDIVLGGHYDDFENIDEWQKAHDKVNALGGLHVIGFERAIKRRFDNQLMGRAGRQGDNGSSVFMVSLEDRLVEVFDSGGIKRIFKTLGIQNDAVNNKSISRVIKNIQKRIENINYDRRKSLYTFDKVNDEIRDLFIDFKLNIIKSDNINIFLSNILNDYFSAKVSSFMINEFNEESWDLDGLSDYLNRFELKSNIINNLMKNSKTYDEVVEKITSELVNSFLLKCEPFLQNHSLEFKKILIERLNTNWGRLIDSLESIKRQSEMSKMIQKIAIDEYKNGLIDKFNDILNTFVSDLVNYYFVIDDQYQKIVQENKIKNMLNYNYHNGITIGYSNEQGIGF